MSDFWLGYAEDAGRREVLMALRRVSPGSAVVFAESARELRERFLNEEPGTVGAIVGHTSAGVSDMNLAAAIVHDGRASEVVLVARGASGSLRSRASRAGIAQVVDATVAPALVPAEAPAPQAEHGAEAGDQASDVELPWEPVETKESGSGEEKQGLGDPVIGTGHDEPIGTGAPAPIIAVASGRGGVGKTALVALLASVAARWDMSVAMVDLDLSCGNLHTCFGVVRSPDLVRIAPDGLATPEAIGRASVRCDEHVHLWGPCERPEMAELVMPHVATLLSYLSTRYDLVVVDTSTTFTDGIAQAVQSCDRLLLVHDERSGAIASAARMSSLAVRLGVARTRIVRVANLCDPRAKPAAFEGRGEVGLETARLHRVPDGGIEAEELLASGKVGELAAADSELVLSVATLLAQALSELGRLPDSDAARKAAQAPGRKRRPKLFGRRKEAA